MSLSFTPSSANRTPSVAMPSVQLATCMVLAEFDIDTGACVRTYYPSASSFMSSNSIGGRRASASVSARPILPPTAELPTAKAAPTISAVGLSLGSTLDSFASLMLPDGAERFSVSRSVFIVNRPPPPTHVRFPALSFAPASSGAKPSFSAMLAAADTGMLQSMMWRKLQPTVHSVEVAESSSKEKSATPAPSGTPFSRLEEHEEALYLDRSTLIACLRRGDGVPLADARPLSASGIRCLPALPNAVAAFAQHLRVPLMPNQQQQHHQSGQHTDPDLEYVFAITERDGNVDLGLLMLSTHLDALLQELAAVQPQQQRSKDETRNEDTTIASVPLPAEVTTADELAAPEANANAETIHVVEVEAAATSAESVEKEEATETSPAPALEFHKDSSVDTSAESDSISTAAVELPPTGVEDAVSQASGRGFLSSPSIHRPDIPPSTPNVTVPLIEGNAQPVLYGLCAVVSRRDSTVRRGGITKSVAVLGPSLTWLEPFFPILVEAAQYCCDVVGCDGPAIAQQSKALEQCFISITRASPLVAAALTRSPPLVAEVRRFCTLSEAQRSFIRHRDSSFGTGRELHIPIAPTALLSNTPASRYSVETLIDVLGCAFMHLVDAILTERRIMVLSRQGMPTDVCEATLALGRIGELLDGGFMERKVFPYASVNNVDHFRHVPGYIAGTLNPIFEDPKIWGWHVLCDLDRRCVVRAPSFDRSPFSLVPSGPYSGAGGGGGGGLGSLHQDAPNSFASVPSGAAGGGAAASSRKSLSLAANISAATVTLANAVAAGVGATEASQEAEAREGLSPVVAQLYRDLAASAAHMRILRVPAEERTRRLLLTLEERLHTLVMVGLATSLSAASALSSSAASAAMGASESGETPSTPPLVVPVPTALSADFNCAATLATWSRVQTTSLLAHMPERVLHPSEGLTMPLLCAALRRCVRDTDVFGIHRTLQGLLKVVHTEEEVLLLLRRMPVAVGGLDPVGMQLTHSSLAVRRAAVELLSRIEAVPDGKASVSAMNSFFVLIYEDVSKRLLTMANK